MKVIHKKLRGSANYGPPCKCSYSVAIICFFFRLYFVCLVLVGATSSKKPKALPFQIGMGWNLARSVPQSNPHRLTWIWRHTFRKVSVTSFHK